MHSGVHGPKGQVGVDIGGGGEWGDNMRAI